MTDRQTDGQNYDSQDPTTKIITPSNTIHIVKSRAHKRDYNRKPEQDDMTGKCTAYH